MPSRLRSLLWLRYFLAVLVLGNFVLIFVVARDSGGGTQVPSDPGPALDGGGPGGPPLLANLPGLGPPAAPGLPVAGLPRIGPPMPTAPIDSPLATPGPAIRLARRSPSFPGSEFMDVALSPPYAYLTGGLVGLAVYRIETPARPQGDVRFTPLPKSLLGGRGYRIVVVRPGLIAISNTLEGVVLVDVRDPESPRLLSQIRSPEGAFEGMAVHGDQLLVARHAAGLAVYDVGDPTKPTPGALLADVKEARDVAVSGDTALVADGRGGLAVASLAGGTARLLGRVALEGEARRVVAGSRHAYVALGHRGIDVVDISSPTAPRRVGHLSLPAPAFSLALADGVLYAGTSGELAAWSLADPARPAPLHFASVEAPRTDGTAPLVTGVSATGPWVAVSEWGSVVLGYRDREAPRPAASFTATRSVTPPGRTGVAAPDFRMTGLGGTPYQLSQFRGRTLLLAFFAPY